MTWVLFICAGISWGGCGVVTKVPMASKAECYEALAAVRFNESGSNSRSAYALCRPLKKADAKQ